MPNLPGHVKGFGLSPQCTGRTLRGSEVWGDMNQKRIFQISCQLRAVRRKCNQRHAYKEGCVSGENKSGNDVKGGVQGSAQDIGQAKGTWTPHT